jgi:hypothetical protein
LPEELENHCLSCGHTLLLSNRVLPAPTLRCA